MTRYFWSWPLTISIQVKINIHFYIKSSFVIPSKSGLLKVICLDSFFILPYPFIAFFSFSFLYFKQSLSLYISFLPSFHSTSRDTILYWCKYRAALRTMSKFLSSDEQVEKKDWKEKLNQFVWEEKKCNQISWQYFGNFDKWVKFNTALTWLNYLPKWRRKILYFPGKKFEHPKKVVWGILSRNYIWQHWGETFSIEEEDKRDCVTVHVTVHFQRWDEKLNTLKKNFHTKALGIKATFWTNEKEAEKYIWKQQSNDLNQQKLKEIQTCSFWS